MDFYPVKPGLTGGRLGKHPESVAAGQAVAQSDPVGVRQTVALYCTLALVETGLGWE